MYFISKLCKRTLVLEVVCWVRDLDLSRYLTSFYKSDLEEICGVIMLACLGGKGKPILLACCKFDLYCIYYSLVYGLYQVNGNSHFVGLCVDCGYNKGVVFPSLG